MGQNLGSPVFVCIRSGFIPKCGLSEHKARARNITPRLYKKTCRKKIKVESALKGNIYMGMTNSPLITHHGNGRVLGTIEGDEAGTRGY